MGEDVFTLRCKPSWGPEHDPPEYYVLRDGQAQLISSSGMDKLRGRRQYPFEYPKCEDHGKVTGRPDERMCALVEGSNITKLTVVAFRCQAAGHEHSIYVLSSTGQRVNKVGPGRYQIELNGNKVETLPLTALHPETGEPIDPDARAALSLAHQAPFKDPEKGPRLRKAVADSARAPQRRANVSAALEKRWKNDDYQQFMSNMQTEKWANDPQRHIDQSQLMKDRHLAGKEELERLRQVGKVAKRPADFDGRPKLWQQAWEKLWSFPWKILNPELKQHLQKMCGETPSDKTIERIRDWADQKLGPGGKYALKTSTVNRQSPDSATF